MSGLFNKLFIQARKVYFLHIKVYYLLHVSYTFTDSAQRKFCANLILPNQFYFLNPTNFFDNKVWQ